MKKVFISINIIIILLYVALSDFNIYGTDIIEYQRKYKWLTEKLYKLYYFRSLEYNVPLGLALALIQVESQGKNVISRKNNNGTRDYGRMQINSIHLSHNPRLLLNDVINSKIGFWYLMLVLKKARRNKREALRLYNQGLNGKRSKFKNWKYVNKIMYYYKGIR